MIQSNNEYEYHSNQYQIQLESNLGQQYMRVGESDRLPL